MNERERAILRGKSIVPQTEDEAALKYAVDHAGGGGEPSYEVIAEIPVGTMEKPEGTPYYVFVADEDFPTLDEETYYFNSSNNPSDSVLSYEGQVMGILWNAKTEEKDIIPIDPNKPWYGITSADGKITVISDTSDLTNTTVRILKAAAEPSVLPEVTSADNGDVLTVVDGAWSKAEPRGGNFVVSADFAIGEEGGSPTISFSNLDKTGAEIIEAASAGNVILRGEITPSEGVTVRFDSHLSTITTGIDGGYGLVILHGVYPLVMGEGDPTNNLVTTMITINTETGAITGVTSTVGTFG